MNDDHDDEPLTAAELAELDGILDRCFLTTAFAVEELRPLLTPRPVSRPVSIDYELMRAVELEWQSLQPNFRVESTDWRHEGF